VGIFHDIRKADLHIIVSIILIYTPFLDPRDMGFSIGNVNVSWVECTEGRVITNQIVFQQFRFFKQYGWIFTAKLMSSQPSSKKNGNPDISVITMSRVDNRGIGARFMEGARDFSFTTTSWPDPGSTQPLIRCLPGALLPGVKRPGHGAPCSTKTEKVFSYICTSYTSSWCGA
jgi:hypothetical protein